MNAVTSLFIFFSLFLSSYNLYANEMKGTPALDYSDNQGIVWEVMPTLETQIFAAHNNTRFDSFKLISQLKSKTGRIYYLQWMFTRVSIVHDSDPALEGWDNRQLYTSQIVINQDEQIWKQQRNVRGGIGEAGTFNQPLRFWIDNWSYQSLNTKNFPADLTVETDDFHVKLNVKRQGPYTSNVNSLVRLEGKSASMIPYEVNAPWLDISGELTLNGEKIKVSGTGWAEKKWGDRILSEAALKKANFYFKLTDGQTLSLVRYESQQGFTFIFGNLFDKEGQLHTLNEDDIEMKPLSYKRLRPALNIPLSWSVKIPKYNIYFTVKASNQNLWLAFWLPHWQGPVDIHGPINGRGYMQLAGYCERQRVK